MKTQKLTSISAAIILACLAGTSAWAANIGTNDVTAVLWPGGAPFTFFDSASTGGGDTAAAASVNFDRGFGTLNVGVGGSEVNIRGIGWASGGASSFNATNVIGTITYLGADGISGGGNDVVIGKVTNNVTANTTASEWVWLFDSPITNTIDGASNIFRINLTSVGTNTMRFKTTSGTAASAAKLSVAGGSTGISDALLRTWVGDLSATWDTTALNWTNADFGTLAYTNGTKARFDDTLDATALNTNITLSATHLPLSVTFNNSTYNYSLSGGDMSGAMTLTKLGAGALTLNVANNHSGGSTLGGSGVVRIANDSALGTGAVFLSGAGLSSDGATARTITNAVTVSANTVLGDAVTSGTLTFSGPMNFGAGGRDLIVNSPVIFSGALTNGGLDEKKGPGTLTYSGVTGEQTSGQWQIEDGNFVISGGSLNRTGGGIRIGNTNVDGVSRLIITNGAVVNVTVTGLNARVGSDQAPGASATSTNILDLSGTLAWLTNQAGFMFIGTAGQFSQINLLAGGLLQIAQFSAGANTSELNLNGGTLSPTTNRATFLQGLTSAFVRSGGVTFDTRGFDIGVAQPLLDGTGGGGLTKIGNGVLSLNGINTYTGLTAVSAGSLGGTGVVSGPVTISATGTLAPGNSIGTLTISNSLTLAGNVVIELDSSAPQSNDVVNVTGSLAYGGTLTPTNLGPALVAGDSFQIFSPGGSGSITVAGLPGVGLNWNFSPASGVLSVVAPPSGNTNSDLANLLLTPLGTLSPTFVSNVLSYTATESYANSPITVTPTSVDANALIEVLYAGATNVVLSGNASGALNLDPNPAVPNVVTVRVTGSTTNNYAVTVTRQPSQVATNLVRSLAGDQLTLNWPVSHTGWTLQTQTNSRAVGLVAASNAWFTVVGSTGTNAATMTVSPADPTVFFRLRSP